MILMASILFLVDKRVQSKLKFFDHLKEYALKKILIIEEGFEEMGGIPTGCFDEVYVVNDISSYSDLETIMNELMDRNDIQAVIATTENIIEVAGRLRTRFGIQGMQHNQATSVRNKWVMKEIARQHGILSPRIRIASTERKLRAYVELIGYPCIIKPVAGWATIKTYRIEDQAQFDSFVSEWSASSQPVLIEEFISGKEFHVDSVVSQAGVVFTSVSEYLFNCLDVIDHQKPLGSIAYPSQAKNELVTRLKQFNQSIIRALGITNSVCHAEIFVTAEGTLYFGEIAARIGGIAVIPPIILNTHGVDLFQAAIDVELGIYQVDPSKQTSKYTGMLSFPSAIGKVKTISSEQDFTTTIEGVVSVTIPVRAGQVLSGGKDTMSRSGFIVIEGNSFEEVRLRLMRASERFQVEIEGEVVL